MALIIKRPVFPWIGDLPDPIAKEASSYYITLPSRYLSESYDLHIGDCILGTTEMVSIPAGKRLEGKLIMFVLYPLLGDDYLLISKTHWEEFRERGLVEPAYELQVRLLTAVKGIDKERIILYSKVDKTI